LLFEIVTTTGGWLKGRLRGEEGKRLEKEKKNFPKQLCKTF
jgi:hypothetical protein